MTLFILSAVAVGFALGWTVLPASVVASLDKVTSIALTILVGFVGVSIGRTKNVAATLRTSGLQMLATPLGVAIGSLIGSLAAGAIFRMDMGESLAVGAGFGWYSLSAVLLAQLHSPALGALAFVSNVLRELIAVILMPLLAKHVHPVAAVVPGGATTMDTTLPVIARCTDAQTSILAFVNGVVLSTMVPILVPAFLKL